MATTVQSIFPNKLMYQSCLIFSSFIEIYSNGPCKQWIIIGSDKGKAPNTGQAIIKTRMTQFAGITTWPLGDLFVISYESFHTWLFSWAFLEKFLLK